ncbi:MAG: hypothetical protein ABNH26_04500 [Celeribacter sp.]
MMTLDEPVALDPDRLGVLYAQLGNDGAVEVMCRAMDALAGRLADLDGLEALGDLRAIAKLSHSLIGIADQIGMAAVARVAGDVATCARRGDAVALAATLSRLRRQADRALSALWQDVPLDA